MRETKMYAKLPATPEEKTPFGRARRMWKVLNVLN
jgi:hypothetical protein